MKRADLKPGMAVYWVRYRSAVEKCYDDPDDSRYVFTGLYRYERYSINRGHVEDPKGNRARLTREVPADEARGREAWTDINFVPLAQILGPYDEVAPERRKLIATHKEQQRAKDERTENDLARREAVRDRAAGAGYPTLFMSHYSDLGEVRIGVPAFEKLLDDLEAARRELRNIAAFARDHRDSPGMAVVEGMSTEVSDG